MAAGRFAPQGLVFLRFAGRSLLRNSNLGGRMVRAARMKRSSRAVRVQPASCGQGVFARRRFRAGETIGEIQGEVIHDDAYWSAYCIDLGDGAVLEPASPYRYLNHHCRPNCELVIYSGWDDQTGVLRQAARLRALADVQPGEELTIDYAWPPICAIPCLCGSKDCRGWIVAPGRLDELLEKLKNN
jgi:hypothetical protein